LLSGGQKWRPLPFRPKAMEFRMLFRAVFWIGVVALLMPRENGHDAVLVPHGESPGAAYALAKPAGDCGSCEPASDSFMSALLDRLATVKDDIRAAERARAAHARTDTLPH
jgi:hypothetical protein